MHAHKLLHKLLRKSLPFIHSTRLSALMDAVESLLIGKKLSLTLLGRNMVSQAKERHCIRKMDRLLGNQHLHKEIRCFYEVINQLVEHHIQRPIISVDWSCVNKRKDWHMLRATLNIKGRGLTVYQEVHPTSKENSPKVQSQFLDNLKEILPQHCRPIIVSDAGFLGPWFKKVVQLDFDFVGRVRTRTSYKKLGNSRWVSNCLGLYAKANCIAKHIGRVILAKSVKLECSLVLIHKGRRNRKHINRSGKPTKNTMSHRCSRRNKDPWLLVTSLDVKELGVKKIISIYGKRMQIEEDFRDTKSHQYGFGLRYCQSYHGKRIEVLLLIAALASLVCWLIALAAQKENMHRDYQANTITHRNVLSVIYLACQLVRRKVKFKEKALMDALHQLHLLIQENDLCTKS